VYLSGNQSAVLAADYALSKLLEKGTLTDRHYLVKTIVTTDMLRALAAKYGVQLYGNLLIGFKYIGEVVRNKESTDEVFVMGCEESFGMLKGMYARDKDGATGALPVAEYAAELKMEGKTLVDRLNELYRELGLYIETLESTYYEGADGFSTMQAIMTSFRNEPPKMIGGEPVTAVLDYQVLTRTASDGSTRDIDCVKGNVLVFELGDDRRRITIRPSGTEPKLKFYMQWYQPTDDPEKDTVAVKDYLAQLFTDLSKEALRRVE
jgi:phosphomannomutase